MKKSLLVVIALLCMASLMAAMAFTSAKVTSSASFTVVNSDEALLALIPSEFHNAAFIGGSHPSNAQMLVIDWDKGYNNQDFGIQPYSTYLWEDLFAVRNNSENPIHVKVYLDPDVSPVNIFFASTGVASRWVNIGGKALEFDLGPGEEEWINTKFESGAGMAMGLGEKTFKMIVEAEASSAE